MIDTEGHTIWRDDIAVGTHSILHMRDRFLSRKKRLNELATFLNLFVLTSSL